MCGAQTNEHVYVVANATDGFGNAIELFDYLAEKCVETFSPGWGDECDAILGAEDKMVVEREVGGWHG